MTPGLTTEQKNIIAQMAKEHEDYENSDWILLPVETDDPTTITL